MAVSIHPAVDHGVKAGAANGQKLKVVDPSATIQRYACTGCGAKSKGVLAG